MKATLAATLAAAALLAGLPAAVHAQQQPEQPQGAVPQDRMVTPEGQVTQQGIPGVLREQPGQPGQAAQAQDQQAAAPADAEVTAALGNLPESIQQIEQMQTVSPDKLEVVTLDEAAGIQPTIDQNQQQITELRQAIDAKQELKNALQEKGVSPGDVVAVDVEGDMVKVYARKSS